MTTATLAQRLVGRFKPMADFEWSWPTRIDRDAVEAAVCLDFLAEKRNVVLIAAQGLGKTMVAQNIAHQAVQKGHTALFTTASQMLLDLCSQDSARALERRLKHYERPAVLCIDELGHLVGVVSVRDIVDHIVELFPAAVLNLPPRPVRAPVSVEDLGGDD